MFIQHNMAALNAFNKNTIANSKLGKSLEKLSSGYKINRAGDDAAGLAVSEKMRSQIAGLGQAVKNAQDGISYVQTAEGALQEIQAILQRQRDLSVQAANGSYDDIIDRQSIQEEISRLTEEVDQIACTDFNGKYVFDTTGAEIKSAFGDNISGAVVQSRLDSGDVESFVVKYDAIAGINVGTAKGFTQAALTGYVNKLKTDYLPKMLGGIVSALPTTSKPTVNGMTIGFEFVYQDNSTLAFVAQKFGKYSDGTAASQTLNLSINLKYLTETNGSINMTPDMNTTIAHEMMHAVMDDTVTAGMTGTGVDDFPDWFVEGMAQAVGGAMNYVSDIVPWTVVNNTDYPAGHPNAGQKAMTDAGILAQLKLTQPTDSSISTYLKRLTTNTGDPMMPYEQGYLAAMYLGWLAGGKGAVDKATVAGGLDKALADIAGGKSLEDVVKSVGFASLADFQNKFGDNASVQFVKDLVAATGAKKTATGTGVMNNGVFGVRFSASSAITGGTGSIISPNGLSGDKASLMNITATSNFFTLDPDSQYGKDLVKDLGVAGDKIFEGGGATRPGNSYIHAGGGTTNPGGGTTNPGGGTTNPGGGTTNPGGGTTNPGGGTTNPGGGTTSPGGGVILTNSETMILQVGARTKDLVEFTFNYETDAIGYLNSDLNCTAKGLGLDRLSVSDQKSANDAIDKFDWAINKVGLMRATFGAVQNRLEHKIDNLNNTMENLTAAESTIRDTDMAREMMNFTKEQILSQSSQSMLAQANSLPQQVLSLIGQ